MSYHLALYLSSLYITWCRRRRYPQGWAELLQSRRIYRGANALCQTATLRTRVTAGWRICRLDALAHPLHLQLVGHRMCSSWQDAFPLPLQCLVALAGRYAVTPGTPRSPTTVSSVARRSAPTGAHWFSSNGSQTRAISNHDSLAAQHSLPVPLRLEPLPARGFLPESCNKPLTG